MVESVICVTCHAPGRFEPGARVHAPGSQVCGTHFSGSYSAPSTSLTTVFTPGQRGALSLAWGRQSPPLSCHSTFVNCLDTH
ncbi:hypothetical protein C8R44DRAFT_761419 [Mycena epipterygia]|nr:hypothetical protein C8R44DRAFT_761419 [Mycena epipterygia]